jgi:heme-degrading monooxygenase HmoA
MIARLWHGWTAPEDADDYERLLREELFPRFAAEVGDGYEGAELLRRGVEDGGEVEFLTQIYFDSREALEAFAGEDYEQAHIPPAAEALLARYEDRATHYEVREPR